MATRRSYGDRCGVARALDLVGERWALLVVRELLLGPKRFTDLRTGLPHLSPDVLAQRLRELEEAGIVNHRARTRAGAGCARPRALGQHRAVPARRRRLPRRRVRDRAEDALRAVGGRR